jgi:hypothetical protein
MRAHAAIAQLLTRLSQRLWPRREQPRETCGWSDLCIEPAPMTRLSFVLLLLLAGCGSVLDFTVDQDVPEQVVQGSSLPGPLAALFPLPIRVDIQSKIEAQETGPIDSVKLDSMHLDITASERPDGDSDDWAFIDHVDLYVESSKSGSTLPRVKVGSASAPGAVQRLDFEPEDVNLLPYLNEGCQMTAEASGTAPNDNVSYDGLAVFVVRPL